MRHAVLSSLAALKGVKREELTHGLADLSHAQKLWNVSRFLITKAFQDIENIGNYVKDQILETINQTVEVWLRSALLIDVSGFKRQILAKRTAKVE
ncbi:MAG: hypothetical protein PHD01_07525 [Geobacteraceae bacterium]|nr:hypothetical protein [Geobacteraceae bacterium]